MNPTKVEGQGEVMHGANESAETDLIRRVSRSEDPLRDDLLWGIPNDVTLDHIATLLPRRAYEVVAMVNPDWQRAFQGRMVYDARVRSQTTQKFLIIHCSVSTTIHPVIEHSSVHHSPTEMLSRKFRSLAKGFRRLSNSVGGGGASDDGPAAGIITQQIFKNTFSLFSPSEGRWYKCPPIPGCYEGTSLKNFQYVLLDGSIYVLGGTRSRPKNVDIPSAEVFVLNLAGHPLEWRQCANMHAPRCHPTIGVIHGKIFVFGGSLCSGDLRFEVRNEVYDPELDAWSFIAPTMPSAEVHAVSSIGQQFLACIGWMSRPRIPEEPMSDDKADIARDRKFVVTVGDRGPQLTSTSDDAEEDDMDGLHEIIENRLVDLGKGVEHREPSPAEILKYVFRIYKKHDSHTNESFFAFYYPVKDEWRVFEKDEQGVFENESFETNNVDQGWGSENLGTLDLRQRPDFDDSDAKACVWCMSL